ncbi:MAG: hypothetical protein ACTSUR_07630 [Candidatus Heimdallarchaeaceae archaeon]
MKKFSKMLMLILFISVALLNHRLVAYVPENKLVFDQQFLEPAVKINENLTMAIFVKNYLNYTISNITISLNLTSISGVEFTSCDFGVLTGENLTLNSTMQSTDEFDFTSTSISYGLLTKDYLEINLTQIRNTTKFGFFYNITATQEGRILVPKAHMTYLDFWGDKQELDSRNEIAIEFLSGVDTYNSNLPDWRFGKKISVGLGLIIYGVAPVGIAVISTFVLYLRKR